MAISFPYLTPWNDIMAKKKHPEHVNHERWLVSYADFITLLFAFFVVLFASGQSDKSKQKKLAAAMQTAFAQMAIFDSHSTTPALTDTSGGTVGTPSPVALPMDTAGSSNSTSPSILDGQPLTPQLLKEHVQTLIQKQTGAGAIKQNEMALREVPEGMALSLQEGGFFTSGSADLTPEAIPVLITLAKTLPTTPIRIEGHTDNLPMHSALFASNWELSSARAAVIGRFLLEHSTINPDQISVAGYAEFHPIASNATPEGRAQNRRVDIVFLTAPTSNK